MSTGILQFTKPSYTISEDGVYVGDAVAVSRTGGTDGIASVKVLSTAASARIPADIAKISTTLTWAAGEGGTKLVPISVVKDSIVEGQESIALRLSTIKGAKYAPVKTAELIIIDKAETMLVTPTDDTVIGVVSDVYTGIRLKDLKNFIGAGNLDPNPNPNPNPNPDPHFNNVVLLIRGNGENGSKNIIDSSSNPKEIVCFGDSQISTEKFKYGGSSLSATNQTLGNFIEVNQAINLTSDYTFEAWVYQTTYQEGSIFAGTNIGSFDFTVVGNMIGIGIINTRWDHSVNAAFVYNRFQHIAWSRTNGVQKIFLDGIEIYSANSTTEYISTKARLMCGRDFQMNRFISQFNGFLNGVRLTNGIGRYNGSFNPENVYLN